MEFAGVPRIRTRCPDGNARRDTTAMPGVTTGVDCAAGGQVFFFCPLEALSMSCQIFMFCSPSFTQ